MVSKQEPTIGEYLYQVRQLKGWTLREAAQHIGLTHARVDEIEKGVDYRTGKTFHPSYMALVKFAKAYGLPYEELLRRGGYEPMIELTDLEKQVVNRLRRLPISAQRDVLAYVEVISKPSLRD
jgi:transcriptional regulator with XRE-family HTH domain